MVGVTSWPSAMDVSALFPRADWLTGGGAPAEPSGAVMRGSPLHQQRPCASPARHRPAACGTSRSQPSAASPGLRRASRALLNPLHPEPHAAAGRACGKPSGRCGWAVAGASWLEAHADYCSSRRPGGGGGRAEGPQPKASWGAGGGAKPRAGPEAGGARRVPLAAAARRAGGWACAAPDLARGSAGRASSDMRYVPCWACPAPFRPCCLPVRYVELEPCKSPLGFSQWCA